METHLTFDNRGKQLGILVKERLTTDQNLQLKVVGVLNTVTGGLEYCAKLRKFFGVPKPRARVANTLPKDYFLTLKRKGQVGIGVTYLSGTDDILTGAVAQKQFLFGPALNPLSLKLKAQADYNTQTQQVDGVGRVQISKTVYNFTDMQDMRLVLGCKAHVDQKGKITPTPYGRLQENNWSLFFNFRGYWGVRYDL
ncbi:hypothetical protein WJX75_006026 [Coccomyxa subellipsoidea]|uniref:Uncharacterized protein n=1 Tax=Coccomyxa subellipsoidea TaxID=248742 RepID=A0ABR2YD28_9CHLO